MILEVRSGSLLQVRNTGIDIGQMTGHGQRNFRFIVIVLSLRVGNICQISHNVVRGNIDTVVKAVRQDIALGVGGGDQMTHVARRILRLNGHAGGIALLEPFIGILKIHQVIQFLHGSVTVGLVILFGSTLGSDGRLTGHNVRQEEQAIDLTVLMTGLIQDRTGNITGIQETSASGTAGDTGNDVNVYRAARNAGARVVDLLDQSRLQLIDLGKQQITSDLAHAAGSFRRHHFADLVDIHPVHQRILLDLCLLFQKDGNLLFLDGEELFIRVQSGRAG